MVYIARTTHPTVYLLHSVLQEQPTLQNTYQKMWFKFLQEQPTLQNTYQKIWFKFLQEQPTLLYSYTARCVYTFLTYSNLSLHPFTPPVEILATGKICLLREYICKYLKLCFPNTVCLKLCRKWLVFYYKLCWLKQFLEPFFVFTKIFDCKVWFWRFHNQYNHQLRIQAILVLCNPLS